MVHTEGEVTPSGGFGQLGDDVALRAGLHARAVGQRGVPPAVAVVVLGDGHDVAHARIAREVSDRVGVESFHREVRDEVVELLHLGEVLAVPREDLGERHVGMQCDVGQRRIGPERPVPVGVLLDRRERGHGRDVEVDEHAVALRTKPVGVVRHPSVPRVVPRLAYCKSRRVVGEAQNRCRFGARPTFPPTSAVRGRDRYCGALGAGKGRPATLRTWISSCRPRMIPVALAVRTWLDEHPNPSGRRPRPCWLRRPALAEPVGTRRRSDPPADHRRRAQAGRGAPPVEPDRHRLGRSHDHLRRHRSPEGALPLPAARGRGDLVPAVQRARRGQRSREPQHPRRARRRRVRGERAEDLDIVRAHCRVRHPHRSHEPRRTQAQGRLVLHLPDGPAGHRGAPDRRDDRRPHVQRGVLHRRSHPGRRTSSATSTRGGRSPRSRSATSGCRCRAGAPCGASARPPTT